MPTMTMTVLARAENVQASIENSHRILILLTPEFIKDDWSLFALQEVSLLAIFFASWSHLFLLFLRYVIYMLLMPH